MVIAFCLRKGATMKLVIDIPQEEYDDILNGIEHARIAGVPIGILNQVIEDGTPLPKGHGELVDIRPLMRGLYEEIQVGELTYTTSEVCKMLEEETSTIIEADNERGE